MRKILNRGAKRRLRRKQQSARRSRTRSLIRGMEPLEDRRLLAVGSDDNFVQMFNPVGGGVVQTVQAKIVVPFGADRAVALAINHSFSSDLDIMFDFDGDGIIDKTYDELDIKQLAPALGNAEGVRKLQAVGLDTVNSLVFLVPIGSSSMSSQVTATISGDFTADFLGVAGSYHGVNQSDPIGSTLSGSVAAITPGSTLEFGAGVIDKGNLTLDAVMIVNRPAPNGSTGLQEDPLSSDPFDIFGAGVDQIAQLNKGHTPAPGKTFFGGVSTDDDDLPNAKAAVQWSFLDKGANGYSHVVAEINMDTSPDIDFLFDYGDAPDSYGTKFGSKGAIHAADPMGGPKGPILGVVFDAETIAVSDLFPDPAANKDDLNNTDDEDGVTGVATNGVVFGNTFVSQTMGNNIGSIDVVVTGLAKDEIGYINAFVDWGKDGDFTDGIDWVLKAEPILGNGSGTDKATLDFLIPTSSMVVEGKSYLRVRLHTGMMGDKLLLGPTGHANDGEVEDNFVFLEHGAEIHGIKFEDLNGNGVQDKGEPPLPGVLITLKGDKLTTISKTIDFDLKDIKGDPGVAFSFKEDGYVIAAKANHNHIDPAVGNPASSINTVTGGQVTEPITITRSDSGDFYFDEYDIRTSSLLGKQSEEVVFTGLLNGKVVYSFTDDDASLVFDADVNNPFANIPIDELRIIDKHNGLEAGALIDNLDLIHVKDLLGNAVQSVITDKNGMFWFVNLDGGSYTVTEVLEKSDTNGDGVFDAGDIVGGHFVDQGLTASTPTSVVVTIADGESLEGVTFGNFITGSIHGVKFHDLDGDGVFDPDEPRLSGVKFDLFKFVKTTVTIKASLGGTIITKYNWKDVGDATTDIHGEFWFTDLEPGIYEVVEQQSKSIKQSTPQPTLSPNFDKLNTNPATSTTAYQIVSRREFVWEKGASSRIMDLDGSKTLTQDEIDVAKAKGALKVEVLATPAVDAAPADKAQNLWFGNFLLGTITGFKYEDFNRDGKYVPADGDLPLEKALFELKDKNGNIVQSVKTDAAGIFVFGGVAAGDYTINESDKTDTNNDGTPDVDQEMVLDTTVVPVSITSGKSVDLTDTAAEKDLWGNYIFGSIHGIKFLDADGDGIWDKDDKDAKGNLLEPTLDGIKFDLYKFIKSTMKQPASAPAVTTFFWEDVGDATSAQHGEFWFTKLDPGIYEVRERAGQTDKNGVPFGQTTKQPTSVPGSSTNPADSKWEFEIRSRREFVWQLGAASRPIDGMGGPLDGFIDAKEVQAGYNKGALKTEILATPTNPDTPGNPNDKNDENQDLWFGNNLLFSSITGFKYHDVDKSGTFNAGDAGLPNVKMLLTGKTTTGATVKLNAVTDAGGIFKFANLAPSDGTGYTIIEDPLSGDAFVDEPGDGTPDVQQDLIVTGKGTLTVVLAGNQNKDFSTAAADKNIFGNYVFGSIHGVKFHDLDGDGKWDKGTAPGSTEPALSGIKFDLFQWVSKVTTKFVSGKTVVTNQWKDVGDATSNVHGEFWFLGLSPGDYLVVEQKNADWIQTTGQVKDPNAPVDVKGNVHNIGVDKSLGFEIRSRREYVWEIGAASRPMDGMGGPLDGIIDKGEAQAGYNKGALKVEILATPGLDPGESDSGPNRDLWFGNFRAGNITGFKFEDRDQNGVYNPAIDVPLKGVTMLLDGKDGKGNVVSQSTKTAADGSFSFGPLMPSDPNGYIVKESALTDTNSDGTPDSPMQDLVLDLSEAKVVLNSGDKVTLDKNLFANFIRGSIHGVKFHDLDGDGIKDANEPALGGVLFDLYKWTNSTTKLLASNVSKTTHFWTKVNQVSEKTDSHGEFWFTSLDAGIYEVVETPLDANGKAIQLTTGQRTKAPGAGDDPAASKTAFNILSRCEFVWEFGASSRPRDLNNDTFIDANEQQMAYNKSILKKEVLAAPAPAVPLNIFTTGGFEAPNYTTTAFGNGMLEGQPIGQPPVFQRTVNAGPSTANIQNTVFAPGGGTQAVQMNRAAGATDRWGVKVNGFPLTNTVSVTWAMRVEGPRGAAGQFGPFFGVELYDDSSGIIGLLGSLGVDATTGDVLFQEATTGFLTETGSSVTFGAWNNFEIRLNFTTRQYSVFLNGTFLRTEGFVDQANVPGGLDHITDIAMAGLTAAANSDALTGTAYFDNLAAKDIGTPAAPSLWFGNVYTGTINGIKFHDVDANGKFDGADTAAMPPFTKGVIFELKDVNGKVIQTKTSDPVTGLFQFTGVLPGKYTVTESDKTDINGDGTPDIQQDLVLDTSAPVVEIVSVAGGKTVDINKDTFGNYILGSIHGVKFQDFDNDGRWDKSGNQAEPPWQGIKFDLFKLIKQETILLASNITKNVFTWQDVGDGTTDVHGEFWFTGLVPGTYTVREQQRPDVEPTTDQPTKSPVGIDANKDGDFLDAGDFSGLDPNSPNSLGMVIKSGYEFVWELGAHARPRDLNNDGIISADESKMAYNKSVLKTQQLANGGEGAVNGLDLIFGNNFITGSIHGFKFEDIDADGIWDQANPKTKLGAEPGLGGIVIELHDTKGNVALLANGKLARTRTVGGDDPSTPWVEKKGEFWFMGVMPNTYTIHEVLGKSDSNGDLIPDDEQGMVASTPTSTGPITVGPREEWVYTPGAAHLTKAQIARGVHEVFQDGANSNNVNEKLIFGNYITGSIHGFKFLDLNADGKYDPSAMGKERPFEWGAFELIDMSGKSLGIQFTDENGEFWFTDLKPGKYTVRERPDLIDRNDIDGDGHPDIVDANKDGLPEQMGNKVPDTKEGLMVSTPIETTVQIWSREELVWKDGAAMLGKDSTVNVEPDDYPDGKFDIPVDIQDGYPNVVLTEAITGNPIFSITPDDFSPTTGDQAFGHDVDLVFFFEESFGFAGDQGIFQAQFDVPVKSVSIDVIANSGNDRGVLIAYDTNGVFLGSVTTSLLNDTDVNINNDWQKLTFNAPAGTSIGFIQAGGDGLSASDVGLDNLQYVVSSLKEEKLVGTQLMWGDFYAGAIHGLKLQQDSNLPAPNIRIQLIDQFGNKVRVNNPDIGRVDPNGAFDYVETDAQGKFWFLDVKPGFYTISELPSPAVIMMAMPVPVIVGHAEVVAAPGSMPMPYPGLQTVTSNNALTLRNLIEGSIHGLVCNQFNQPVANQTVILNGVENAQTTTNAQGQFHFNDLTPGAYVVNVGGILRIVIVGSGEEEVAMAGLAGQLDPGQFEQLNPDLKIITTGGVDPIPPTVASVKVVSSQWTEPFLDEVDPADGLGYPIPTGADQLKTLPWININEILVKFSEPMNITAADISLHGVSVANYATAFNYDAPTQTASIQLTGGLFIGADKLVLHINDTAKDLAGNALDGEWVNGVSNYGNIGNDTPGGDFNFRLNVLPGDSRQDGQNLGAFDGVLGTDVIKVRNAQFLTTTDPTYSPFDDVNGSGNVSGVDVVAVRNRQFTGLPVGNPVAPPASSASLVDSVFGNGASFGKGDDDDLLLALATGSGSSSDAVFESAVGGDSSEAGAVGSIDDLFAALGS